MIIIGRFYLIGLQLSSKIKQLMLKDEIGDLNNELNQLMTDNRENQLRITSLSKELYAISAISTKINQSMDLKKSLHKSMLKIKEVFRSSGVFVCLKNPTGSNHKLSSIHIEDVHLDARLFSRKSRNWSCRISLAPQGSPEVRSIPRGYITPNRLT